MARQSTADAGNPKRHTQLSEDPPIFVNGMVLSSAVTPTAPVVAISFFTTYADPRDEDPDSAVRKFHPPVMMHLDAAKALHEMLGRQILQVGDESAEEEGGGIPP